MTVELPESLINGRFKFLEKPAASPGKCSVCGSVEKSVLDFGLDVDYYGAVVICVECMRNAMQIVDLYETSTVAPVVPPINFLDVEAVNEYVTRANASLASLNAVLAAYSSRLVDATSAEKPDDVHDESESTDESVNEPSVAVSLSEGSSSVPTSNRSESADVFGL